MKRWLLAIMLLLLLLTGGCDFKDIDRRIFVVAIGVDSGEKEGHFKISLKLALPQGEITKMDEKVQILTEESFSISEAVRRMKSRVEKELDFVHCKSIILGETLAQNDIRHIMDWAVRRRDLQLILHFAVGRPDALKVLQIKPQSERIPSNSLIMAMSGQGTESPFISKVFSYQLMRNIYEKGLDPILPIIEARGQDEFVINKIALFDKHRIRETLTPNETRLFNLLSRPNLRTNLPAFYKGEMYQYYTERSTSSYRIFNHGNGEPTLRYKIKIKGILEESGNEDIVTQSLLKEIGAAGEEELRKKVHALLRKIQASHQDPLGWGLRYGARHFNNRTEMEDWADLYAKLRFQVDVQVNIKYSGITK
ncbi:Ger(x)C family spore germination protein [Paenibacillus albidus]|uniref:Ger(x)C family spore germination protein n=1 Tax=Paenibacillus albidus TaxID=2041023 RepID=UPI001BEB7834|nr:Ger(x)C family spore germination protein [Paenibacillus albidus]MBT2288203.1 Ger(x)C family spore germination protein [Paenibacillus albidus]